jgi:hypothetical protein
MIIATQKYKHYTIVYMNGSYDPRDRTDEEIRQHRLRCVERASHPPTIPDDYF